MHVPVLHFILFLGQPFLSFVKMRKLLRSLRTSMKSTFSLLWPRLDGAGDNAEHLSSNDVVSNQFDDSNHDDDEEDDKYKKQGDDRSPCDKLQPALSQHCLDMPIEDLTRITKQDSKKERRHKYKQCFVRNNVVMVRQNCSPVEVPLLDDLLVYNINCFSFVVAPRLSPKMISKLKNITKKCISSRICTTDHWSFDVTIITSSQIAVSFAWKSINLANT
jgi:hypothetical protein